MSHYARRPGNQPDRAYVITGPRRTWSPRAVVLGALAVLILAVAFVGHVVVLVAGALDALVTAAIGTRRVSTLTRQFAAVARDTWGTR